MENDNIKLCQKCGEYTTGRLCRLCREQEMIDFADVPYVEDETDVRQGRATNRMGQGSAPSARDTSEL